jgi:hypothetical protein
MTLESRSPFLQTAAHVRCKHVFTSKKRVHFYLTSKLFAAVHEAFSDAHPDKGVPNKTTIQTGNKISGHKTIKIQKTKEVTR